MKHEEYLKLKTKLEQEIVDCQKNLEALERVWQMFKDSDMKEPKFTRRVIVPEVKKKKLTSIAGEIINNHSGEFTTRDVSVWIKESYPNFEKEIKLSTLSNILMKFVRKGKIEVKESGSGSSPTIYNTKNIAVQNFDDNLLHTKVRNT